MMPPKISVVIPCYNRHALLARALASVRNQSGLGNDFGVEIIVVDDGSDPPLAPALGIDDCLIRLDAKGGPARARNAGCAAASGDYIAFLDSDDTWRANKLNRQMLLAQIAPDAVICSGYRTRRRSGAGYVVINPAPVATLATFVSGIRFCPGATALMPRALFEKVGPFDETLTRLEDYDWYIRLAERGGRVLIVSEPLADIEPNTTVNLANVVQSSRALRRTYQTRFVDREVRKRFLSFLDLVEAEAYYVNGRILAFLVKLAASLARVPRKKLQLIDDAPQSTGEKIDEAAA